MGRKEGFPALTIGLSARISLSSPVLSCIYSVSCILCSLCCTTRVITLDTLHHHGIVTAGRPFATFVSHVACCAALQPWML